jgi:hypothetical protein
VEEETRAAQKGQLTYRQALERFMQRVFSKLGDGDIEDGGDIASIGLFDSAGKEQRIFLSPDILEDFGHALLVLKSAVERAQQVGIPPDETSGSRFVAKTMRIDQFRVDRPDRGDRVVLNFWNKNLAHYCFSLESELARRLRSRLDAIHRGN